MCWLVLSLIYLTHFPLQTGFASSFLRIVAAKELSLLGRWCVPPGAMPSFSLCVCRSHCLCYIPVIGAPFPETGWCSPACTCLLLLSPISLAARSGGESDSPIPTTMHIFEPVAARILWRHFSSIIMNSPLGRPSRLFCSITKRQLRCVLIPYAGELVLQIRDEALMRNIQTQKSFTGVLTLFAATCWC